MTLLVLPFGTTLVLGGEADTRLAAAAALQIVHHDVGAAAAVAAVTVAARIKHHLAGTAAGQSGASAVSAALKVIHNLAAGAVGASSVTAGVVVVHRLAGSAVTSGITSAALRVKHNVAASSAAAGSAASGATVVKHNLAAVSAAQAATTGSDKVFHNLRGAAVATAAATAAIKVIHHLNGTSAATSTAVQQSPNLGGTTTAISTAFAALRVVTPRLEIGASVTGRSGLSAKLHTTPRSSVVAGAQLVMTSKVTAVLAMNIGPLVLVDTSATDPVVKVSLVTSSPGPTFSMSSQLAPVLVLASTSMSAVIIGARIRIPVTCKNGKDLTDPTQLQLKVVGASGTYTYVYGRDSQLVRDSLGVYYFELIATENLTFKWSSIGPGQENSVDGTLTVRNALV